VLRSLYSVSHQAQLLRLFFFTSQSFASCHLSKCLRWTRRTTSASSLGSRHIAGLKGIANSVSLYIYTYFIIPSHLLNICSVLTLNISLCSWKWTLFRSGISEILSLNYLYLNNLKLIYSLSLCNIFNIKTDKIFSMPPFLIDHEILNYEKLLYLTKNCKVIMDRYCILLLVLHITFFFPVYDTYQKERSSFESGLHHPDLKATGKHLDASLVAFPPRDTNSWHAFPAVDQITLNLLDFANLRRYCLHYYSYTLFYFSYL